jgi:hypothetical protein
MRIHILGIAVALGVSSGGMAIAQTATAPGAMSSVDSSAAEQAVGRWVYDAEGKAIGSVRANDGRTATIMMGSYFQPGSHEVSVPSQTLSIANGKVTIDPQIARALSLESRG